MPRPYLPSQLSLQQASLLALSWWTFLLVSGCGPGRPAPALNVPERKDDPEAKLLDNPDYVNWNRFPSGTTVVRESHITGPEGTTIETTTLKLKDKSNSQLTVEMQVSVQHGDQLTENPVFELTHRAKVRTRSTQAELLLPRPDATKAGTAVLAIEGRDYDAQIFEWIDTVEAGPMQVKVWRSEYFPGRVLRRETQVADKFGKQVNRVETIKQLKIPSSSHSN